ncbi:MAG: hypothetical protein R3C49_19610 [Planctomycetaceae bacterium]
MDRLIERIFSGVILSMVGIDDQSCRIRSATGGLRAWQSCWFALGVAIVARNNEKAAREVVELSEQAAINARNKEEKGRIWPKHPTKRPVVIAHIAVQARDYLKTLFSRVTTRPEATRDMEALVEKASDGAKAIFQVKSISVLECTTRSAARFEYGKIWRRPKSI